jgi:nucleotide-binding universal stress UspA family protein
MKSILIATDFSAASRNATSYALRLAEALKAKPVLFSAWQQVPVLMPDTLVTVMPADNHQMVLTQLESESRLFKRDQQAPAGFIAKEGPVVPAILDAAEAIGAGLIVAGMKARGHVSRRLLGSTITTLARKTRIPVLVIPETATFTPIQNIGLAEDVRWDRGRPTPRLIERFIQEFQCRLYLIRVYSKKSGEVIEVLHQAGGEGRMIGSFTPLHEIPAHGDINDTLGNFISDHPIDILVIRPHPRTVPERWFVRSHTREILFGTIIPILILPVAADLTA